ncbi:MAG: ROK family protein [Oscillospiraceae bacterium]|jgi:glucokinase|nr:ROK family protein [Oscillospiraceae bacterium]
MGKYNLGVDLGGTDIKVGVVKENGEEYTIIARGEAKTQVSKGSGAGIPANKDADIIVSNIVKACNEAIESAGITWDEIETVGVGSPGAINRADGIVVFAGNLNLNNFPLANEIEKKIGKKVFLCNDADAAVVGEFVAGEAKGKTNAVCVTLGTGVGGGIIIGGKLYSGSNLIGGEVGHMVIQYNGIKCNCGRKGCFERYASASAIIEKTKEAMKKNRDSLMWEIAGTIGKVDGKTAFKAMKQGDEVAKEVVDEYIKYVACGLMNIIAIFQPEVLCIGGGMSNEDEKYLLEPINEIINNEQFAHKALKDENVKIIPCKVVIAKHKNDAGRIGASCLHKYV